MFSRDRNGLTLAQSSGQEKTGGYGEDRGEGVQGTQQPGLSQGPYLAGTVLGVLSAASSHLIFSFHGELYHSYPLVRKPWWACP